MTRKLKQYLGIIYLSWLHTWKSLLLIVCLTSGIQIVLYYTLVNRNLAHNTIPLLTFEKSLITSYFFILFLIGFIALILIKIILLFKRQLNIKSSIILSRLPISKKACLILQLVQHIMVLLIYWASQWGTLLVCYQLYLNLIGKAISSLKSVFLIINNSNILFHFFPFINVMTFLMGFLVIVFISVLTETLIYCDRGIKLYITYGGCSILLMYIEFTASSFKNSTLYALFICTTLLLFIVLFTKIIPFKDLKDPTPR